MTISNMKFLAGAASALALLASGAGASTTVGTYGTLGADGVVTAPPGGGNYSYVTTAGGADGGGQITGVGGTNGSSWTSDAFTANLGDVLKFDFNYVTTDGAEFADYGWAALLDSTQSLVGYLFTARTTISGDTSPGYDLPTNMATLTPASSAIIGGAPTWSPLGNRNGNCWADGCGYTGWINSTYTIGAAGTYYLQFGVANFIDTDYDSGLAWAGAKIGDVEIDPVPVPATLPLLAGALAIPALIRRRKAKAA